MASSLENLPLHILESICEYLADYDSKRCSLFAFSLASKSCCFAADRERFKYVKFTLSNREKLGQDIQRWGEILAVDGRARYVRHVKLAGSMPLTTVDEDGVESEILPVQWERSSEFDYSEDSSEEGIDDGSEDDDEEDSDYESDKYPIRFDGGSPVFKDEEEKQRQNKGWMPLAQFIGQLPALKDLTFSCTDQVPICILTVLHENHPESRLHIDTFSLRSLYQPRDHPRNIDSDEFAIVTSPCLYSITGTCSDYDTWGNVNFNEEAVLEMMAESAPRLNSVCMLHEHPGDSIEWRNSIYTPRPSWQGFSVDKPKESPKSKGCLQSLSFDGGSDQILDWSNCTDFAVLKSLTLHSVHLNALRTLNLIAKDGKFMSLQTLALFVSPLNYRDHPHLDEATSLLLEHMHPLEHLDLHGDFAEKTFTAVLHRHGQALRSFKFLPVRERMEEAYVMSHRHVQRMQQYCPNLQVLKIKVYRTRNDHEASIYRALSRLPHLKHVSLVLDCSPIDGYDPMNDMGKDKDKLKANLRDRLVKSAIDIPLARSICHTIMGPSNYALNEIALLVNVWDRHYQPGVDQDMCNTLEWIGRSWKCKNDGRGEVQVTEILKEQRRFAGKQLPRNILRMASGKMYQEVWQDLWPEKTGDWRRDWLSFPLSE